MATFKEKTKKLSSSQNFKFIIIGVLILILLIPSGMIQEIIRERKKLNDETETEIQKTWGTNQIVSGPVITIPYYRWVTSEGKANKVKSTLILLPELLKIKGDLTPKIKHRGIYRVAIYTAKLELTGRFTELDKMTEGIEPEDLLWSEARIQLGLSDLRGIQNKLKIDWDEDQYNFEPGVVGLCPFNSGIHTYIRLKSPGQNRTHTFNIPIEINGSKKLFFKPFGEITRVELSSPWESPKFDGAFLPKTHRVNKDGFKATWRILHFNRNYPQTWMNQIFKTGESAFGVNFLIPVDRYQKTMRSVKYAILFLSLTFTLLFFIEMLNGKRLAIIQYFMTGLSLLLFFILLLSLSEHIGFVTAYLVATVAIVVQISLFIHMLIKSLRITLITAGTLTCLYGMLFVLLQLKDYALLIGSIGLFVILGLVMLISGKINWIPENQTINPSSE